jgi:hypothetical protein
MTDDLTTGNSQVKWSKWDGASWTAYGRPWGTASTILPSASAPAGTTTLPFTSMGRTTMALKWPPVALSFEPTALDKRTVTAVPGITHTTAAFDTFSGSVFPPHDGKLLRVITGRRSWAGGGTEAGLGHSVVQITKTRTGAKRQKSTAYMAVKG